MCHGEAVAVGCVFAAEVAHRSGHLSRDALALHRQSLEAVGLPTSFTEGHGRWEELKVKLKILKFKLKRFYKLEQLLMKFF